jgi:hypothetical protein
MVWEGQLEELGMATAIEYNSTRGMVAPVQFRRARILLRMAQICAIVPAFWGVGIVLIYWAFDWEWLAQAGLVIVAIGAVVVVTGLALVIAWAVTAWKMGMGWPWRVLVGMLLVLLASFAVALMCAALGAGLASQARVVVELRNESGVAVDRGAIGAAWSRTAYGRLAAGSSESSSFRAGRSNVVHVRVEQGGNMKEIDIATTSGIRSNGGTITVWVKPGLGLESKQEESRRWDD